MMNVLEWKGKDLASAQTRWLWAGADPADTALVNADDFRHRHQHPTLHRVRKLFVEVDTAPGGANSITFTVADDGVATACVATITGAATTATSTVTADVAADSTLSIEAVASATITTSGRIYARVEVDD